jgi:Delta7-sterol 5-desaturase
VSAHVAFEVVRTTTLRVAVGGVLYFLVIYWGFALASLGAARALKALRIGRVLDERRLKPRQIAREVAWSSLSIGVFGVGLVLPWWLLQAGWVQVRSGASVLSILAELALLLVWNDVHFYACHRLLHTRPFYGRFHLTHHRSVVTTPFSTYAFHPLEALLLGSVPLGPMLVHAFSWQALLLLPVTSLLFNAVGHANYDPFPSLGANHWFTSGRRHQLHHAHFRGNYGFLFSFMDHWFNTQLPDAAPGVAAHPRYPERAP